MFTNKETNRVTVKNIPIGGGAPISIQSMLNIPAHSIEGNIRQAQCLKDAGCDILRIAVPDKAAVKTVAAIKERVDIPLVADIHFDWRLAIDSIAAGIDKVRINPGNIGSEEHIRAVAKAANEKNIPIRIGINSGSLEKHILEKYGSPTPEAMVESGLYHISLLNKFDFDNIVLSLKSSNVQYMYNAYLLAAQSCPYPLHLGVTEAGTRDTGTLKSAAGIGGLLLRSIGDTIRISLTDDPVNEVVAAKELLSSLGLRSGGVKFISCPTCGRTAIDLIALAKKAEERFKGLDKNITIAVMGCVVNGPGEAKEADIGIAGGNGCGIIFKNGKILHKNIAEEKLIDALAEEIEKM